MRLLLSPEHKTVLTDPQTWWDNPFIRREARRDRKRRQPFISVLWMCLVLGTLVGLALWGLYWLFTSQDSHHLRVAYLNGFANAWFLGDGFGTTLCIALCGIHIAFVSGVSQKHTLRLMTQEISQNTLPSLLMLPISPFQMALQTAVYPWLASMRQALLMLPIYVLCVGLDGISWLDLLMLYVVFALSSVTFLRWNRPVLSENVTVMSATPQQVAANNRAMTTTQSTALAAGAGNYSYGQWVSMAFLIPFLMFTMQRGSLVGLHESLHAYFPDSILVLLPTSFLSWPLIIARGLVTPFDWYGMPLPPLFFVLVMFLLNRYTQLVRVSEFLSVGYYRDLVKLPTYMPRRKLEGALRIAQAFLTVGYLWKWGVWDGGLSRLVNTAGLANSANGLLGFAFLLMLIAIWRGIFRASALAGWLRETPPNSREAVVKRITFSSGLRYFCEPFVFASLLYFACCVVSRTSPFAPAVFALWGKMLAIGAAAIVLRFVADRSLGFLANISLLILPLVAYYPKEAHRLMVLSPTLGLFRLGNPRVIGLQAALQNPFPWWHWVAALSLIALPFAVLSFLLQTHKSAQLAKPEALALDPTRVGTEAFLDAVFAETRAQQQTDSSLAGRFIAALQTFWDNAVMVKELRARLRGKLQPQMFQKTFLVCLVITLIPAMALDGLAEAFGGSFANSLYGQTPGQTPHLWASITCCWYIGLLIMALSTGIQLLPQAFAVESEKSTLGFMLASLLRPTAIVLGKAAGLFLSAGLNIAAVLFWTFLLSVFLTILGVKTALIGWLMMLVTALTIFITAGMVGIAIASLFPRLANTKVTTWIQVVMFYGLMFGPQFLGSTIMNAVGPYGLQGHALWFAILLTMMLVTTLATILAIVRISRMQTGTIAFAETKREN